MVRILVIQHQDGADARRFGDWLTEAGAELVVRRPDLGEPVPGSLDGYDALMVLGGSPGPLDDETHPWLPATRALQRRTAADGDPSFNICLGGELAAVAHGARVRRRDRPQAGVYEVRRRPEADDDPVFSAMPQSARAVLWHQEEIAEIPAGAVHLVDGTQAPVQAFRVGRACWATQFHPEPDPDIMRSWTRITPLAANAGRSAQDVLAEYAAHENAIEQAFRPVAVAFVEYVRRHRDGRHHP